MVELSLRGDDHSDTMLKTLEGLLQSNVLVDCTLAAEGRFLKAHRVVLSSCSPYFQLLFSQDTNQHPIILFKDIEYKYLKMVLEYVYHGRIQVCQAQLSSFLEVANALQIVGLDTKKQELISEESGSQFLECNVKGSVTQLTQQGSEDGFGSKSVNTFNSDFSTNFSPISAPVQMDEPPLDNSIHIQSVYSLTSEITSVQQNLVTENVKFHSEVSNSKCNIKVEPVNKNHDVSAVNKTEQAMVCDGSVFSPRNRYSSAEVNAQVGQLHSSVNLNTTNRVCASNGSSKTKYPCPESSAHTTQINTEESHGFRVKRVKLNPFSSGTETQVTNVNNKLLIENANGSTEQVKSAETQFAESISLPARISMNEIGVRNVTNVSEIGGNSVNGVKSSKKKTTLPKCVVQAERIVVDKCVEGKSSTSHQRKVLNFRVLHPNKDSVRNHAIKEEKSTRVHVKEDGSADGEEKATKVASVHGHPPSSKVTIISAGSGSQKPEMKNRAIKEGKSTRVHVKEDGSADGEEKAAKFASVHGLPSSTKVTIISAGSGSQKPESRQSRRNSNQDDKSTVLNHVFNRPSDSSEKMWPCNICDKQLCDKNALIHHVQLHTGEKPFCCIKCDKVFAHKNSLICHERTHTNEKPYKCNKCNRSFFEEATLTRHMLNHSDKRPFKCKFCDKSFIQHPNLVSHLQTHSKEKPFICNICEQRFALKENLVSHIQIHTGEKPYECSICKKTFTQHSALSRHLQTHSDNNSSCRS